MGRLTLIALAAIALFATQLQAQTELERFERQLEQIRLDTIYQIDKDVPVSQRTLLDYGAYISTSYLSLDDNNLDNHVLWQHELVGYGRLNIDGVHDFFARGRLSYRDFHSGDAFDNTLPGESDEPEDQEWLRPVLERAFYQFNLARAREAYEGAPADYNVIFKGGRDLVYWGNGLTLVQVLDGVVLDLHKDPFQLQLIAGITPEETVDFDSSRPDFDDDTRRGFFGAMLTARVGNHRPYVYALSQRDYNTEDEFLFGAPPPAGGFITEYDYNSYYLGVGSAGALSDHFLYGVEAVYEGGNGLSSGSDTSSTAAGLSGAPGGQDEEDIRAWAANARLDYLFADDRNTRIGGDLILASGDDDRGETSSTFSGNLLGTDDEAFNGFGLLNTGQSFAGSVSNMFAVRVGASTFPLVDVEMFRRMQVGVDVFVFNKLDKDAPIDETTLPGESYLGWEPDFYVNWQISSDLSLAVRYGVFFPNADAFEEDLDEPRHFFFTSLTLAF